MNKAGKSSRYKKASFVKGMTQGRAAMQKVREVVLTRIWEESNTRYSQKEYTLIREMSPLFNMSFVPRIGHLGQILNSTKRSVLFMFIEEKINYAHAQDSTCYDESLFQGRQWCYVSIQSLMRTGLFSGRADAQAAIRWFIDTGLLYDRKRKRDSDKSNQATWYSVEYFHPALIFSRKELLNKGATTLRDVATRLLNNEIERGERAKKILERLIKDKKVRKVKEQTQ